MEKVINNDIYHELGERWYEAYDDPVALLRAESKLIAPWIHEKIKNHFSCDQKVNIADLGCGAGFISNTLAKFGHNVTGIDLSASSLDVAKKYDLTKSVNYQIGDVMSCPLASSTFDVAVSCDVIEHIDKPRRLIEEAFRILKPGGIFFFHTFDRNFMSDLIVIRLVEWLVKNTPAHLHVKSMFIKPQEMKNWCHSTGFTDFNTVGIRPSFRSLLDPCLLKGHVPKGLSFKFTQGTWISYGGYAIKPALN